MKKGLTLSLHSLIPPCFSILQRPVDILLVMRPKTLPASTAALVSALAVSSLYTRLNLPTALLTLFCAAALQASANVWNDYLDYLKGNDTVQRLGPERCTHSGRILPAEMQCLVLATTGSAIASGFFLVREGGVFILITGILCLAALIAYSLFKKPMGFSGGGETAAFLFFGPIATIGTQYLQGGTFLLPGLFVGISTGLYSLALLSVNNYRDYEEDSRTGKMTLCSRFGKPAARFLYAAMFPAALTGPILLVFISGYPIMFLLPAITLIPGLFCYRKLYRSNPDRSLNTLLFHTSLTMLLHGLLYAAAAALCF